MRSADQEMLSRTREVKSDGRGAGGVSKWVVDLSIKIGTSNGSQAAAKLPRLRSGEQSVLADRKVRLSLTSVAHCISLYQLSS